MAGFELVPVRRVANHIQHSANGRRMATGNSSSSASEFLTVDFAAKTARNMPRRANKKTTGKGKGKGKAPTSATVAGSRKHKS